MTQECYKGACLCSYKSETSIPFKGMIGIHVISLVNSVYVMLGITLHAITIYLIYSAMAENQLPNNAFSFCLYVTCIRSSHFNAKTKIRVQFVRY